MEFFKNRQFKIDNPCHRLHGQAGVAVTEPDANHVVVLRMSDGAHVCQYLGCLVLVSPQQEECPAPSLAVVLDTPSRYPDNPVARLAAERDELRQRPMAAQAEIDRLTPKWQEGEPPANSWVWRESQTMLDPEPVQTRYAYDGPASYYDAEGTPEPWGTARWAPIPRPT